jgi:hypothetical protein
MGTGAGWLVQHHLPIPNLREQRGEFIAALLFAAPALQRCGSMQALRRYHGAATRDGLAR